MQFRYSTNDISVLLQHQCLHITFGTFLDVSVSLFFSLSAFSQKQHIYINRTLHYNSDKCLLPFTKGMDNYFLIQLPVPLK